MKIRLSKRGFTLIEVLISVAIFMAVMTVAIGALIMMNNSLQKAKLLRASVENVNLALESMSKRLRTGLLYRCLSAEEVNYSNQFQAYDIRNCDYEAPEDGFGVSFYSQELEKFVAYRWGSHPDLNKIEIATSQDAVFSWSNDGDDTLNAITSAEVKIKNLRFYVSGSGNENPAIQPRVTILINASAELPGKTFLDTNFNLQTTVSQRIFEVY